MSLKMINFLLTVWNQDITPVGLIDQIISLEWTSKLNTVGGFTLSVPLTQTNIEVLQIGNLITRNQYDQGPIKETCIINYKQIAINKDGIETLVIKGQSLLTWLGQRVLTQNYNVTDTLENIAREIVNNESITPSNPNRIIPNLILGDNKQLQQQTTFFPNSQYPNLLNSLTSLLSDSYFGMHITMDTINKNFVFNIFQGVDKTISSSAEDPILFSSEMNNIMSEEYTHTKVNYKNTGYIYAQLSDQENKLVMVGDQAAGVNRSELGINAGNPTLNGQQFTLTEANYKTLMTVLGQQTLAQNDITHSFTGKLNMDCGLIYKVNFNLGDTITAFNKLWGLNKDLVIVAVSEQYSVNGMQIQLTFGYPLPTILELINKKY